MNDPHCKNEWYTAKQQRSTCYKGRCAGELNTQFDKRRHAWPGRGTKCRTRHMSLGLCHVTARRWWIRHRQRMTPNGKTLQQVRHRKREEECTWWRDKSSMYDSKGKTSTSNTFQGTSTSARMTLEIGWTGSSPFLKSVQIPGPVSLVEATGTSRLFIHPY